MVVVCTHKPAIRIIRQRSERHRTASFAAWVGRLPEARRAKEELSAAHGEERAVLFKRTKLVSARHIIPPLAEVFPEMALHLHDAADHDHIAVVARRLCRTFRQFTASS